MSSADEVALIASLLDDDFTKDSLDLSEEPSIVGRWTDEEHETFLAAMEIHGRDWRAITAMIPTRTLMQVRTHAQKYFKKLNKEQTKVEIVPDQVDLQESRWNSPDAFKDLKLETPADKRKKHHVGERRHRSPSVPCPDSSGRRESDLLIKKKNRPLRSGRWTKGEGDYAMVLIKHFDQGLLPIPDGIMLRIFLATELHCDPMRISKKFAGNSAIGKQVYKRDEEKIRARSAEQVLNDRQELAMHEHRFLVESNQLNTKDTVAAVTSEPRHSLSLGFDSTTDEEALAAVLEIWGDEETTAPVLPVGKFTYETTIPESMSYSDTLASTDFHPSLKTNRRNSQQMLQTRNSKSIEDLGGMHFSEDWNQVSTLLGEPVSPEIGHTTKDHMDLSNDAIWTLLSEV